MQRTVRFSLNEANTGKKQALLQLHKAYIDGVNQYLQIMIRERKYILSNQEVKENNAILSEGIKQCAYNQAVKIWKGWRRSRNRGELPEYKGCINLKNNCILIRPGKKSFDYVARISTLNRGKRVIIPFKSYDYANEYWKNWELCKGGKIQIQEDGKIFLLLTFKKDTPPKKDIGKVLGIDVGIKKLIVDSEGNQYGKEIEAKMNKIQRKQQGSKAFKRALRERDEYINKTVKELPLEETKTIVIEGIKNIKKNTKKERRLNKSFRSKFHWWTYAKLLSRINQLCEVAGVQCHTIDPAYTSQTCPKCGFVHNSNRVGEHFVCRNCGYREDADFVGAQNVLALYLGQELMVPASAKRQRTFSESNIKAAGYTRLPEFLEKKRGVI